MKKFKENQVVIATKEQTTSCGIIIVHKGAICMVRRQGDRYMSIWRSKRRRERGWDTDVLSKYFREATKEEEMAFENGIRNIDEL